jgi:membrane protease YdiL (CAAX protease family)
MSHASERLQPVSDAAEQRWPPWYGLVALVAGLIVGTIAAAIALGGSHSTTLTPAGTDVSTAVQDLGFVAAAVWLATLLGPVRPRQFGLVISRKPLWQAILLVLAGLGSFYLISLAWLAALHTSGAEKGLVKDLGGDSGTFAVLVACALTCVLAPICEELLFRGFMFTALRNWRGPWPAAVITALIFGGVHGFSAPAADLLPLAFLGFALCVVYEWTGSLYPCIALHVLNNAIAFGADEHWEVRIVELAAASLASVALVLALVGLASARWTPASD